MCTITCINTYIYAHINYIYSYTKSVCLCVCVHMYGSLKIISENSYDGN